MLAQLVALTNTSHASNQQVSITILEASSPPPHEEVTLTLEIYLEDARTLVTDKQLWEVTCFGVVNSGGLLDYNWPSNQLNVYTHHPVLFNFEAEQAVLHLQGPCSNLPALVGALYLAHGQACGYWVNFENTIFHLAAQLEHEGFAELVIPTPLVSGYIAASQQQGLACSVVDTEEAGYSATKLHALVFGAPRTCPDDVKLWQPYVVAERFTEKRLE